MGDSESGKRRGIPSWQQSFQSTKNQDDMSDKIPDTEPAATQDSTSVVPEESLAEQAVRFLRDESIQNAPSEEKRAFLESKGVRAEDIDRAIGVIDAEQKSNSNTSVTSHASHPSTSQQASQLVPRQDDRPPPLPAREIPPIITYPEFLVHSSKPPPLITASRLINTAYIASGIAAVVYGASKYIITPMTDTLTDARHDFALHSQARLAELNTKMQEIASTDPKSTLAIRAPYTDHNHGDTHSDIGTDASDPTELYHRDFGTQTAPELDEASMDSRSTTSSSAEPRDMVSQQTATLKHLHSLCADLVIESDSNGATTNDISVHLGALQSYLDDLHYPNSNLWPGAEQYGGGAFDSKKENDEIARVKAEIRTVKGFFLSARNFPRSSGGPVVANCG